MSGIGGLPPIPVYLAIEKNEQQYAARVEKTDAPTQSNIAYFQSVAPKLTSPQALLGNYRALEVVLGAFGLGSAINETGILKDLMTQNPADPTSLAQQSANPLYLRFAQFLSRWNPPPFSDPKTIQTIISQYQLNQFEQNEGNQIPGMQQALYFTRTIGTITSIDQLMADPTLLNVVETVTNQPQQFGLLDFNQQVAILSKAVDLSKFKNPAYIQKYVEQYLALIQENPPPAPGPSGVLALFQPSNSANGGLGQMLSLLG